ncbi:MAG: hypothetical protein C4542_07865 [Dehalococcoidia bacterium]|nr:MAG: hypothetical protein C4542_07865 [Dehalococcoidia bacterium]
MNAFEDIVALYLEENGYWVRQHVKVHNITKEDKVILERPSLPTPEIDIVAYEVSSNTLVLVEVKSLLDSYGVHYYAVSGSGNSNSDKADARKYRLFNDDGFRKIITERLREEYLGAGLINAETSISYALVAGNIATTWDEEKLKEYFKLKEWRLILPEDIRKGIRELAKKGWEDSVVVMTAKLVKEVKPL